MALDGKSGGKAVCFVFVSTQCGCGCGFGFFVRVFGCYSLRYTQFSWNWDSDPSLTAALKTVVESRMSCRKVDCPLETSCGSTPRNDGDLNV